jgi:hypothetical protein
MPQRLSRISQRLLLAIRSVALLLLALRLLAPALSEDLAWGLWPATYQSLTAQWLLAIAAATFVVFGERLWAAAIPVRATLGRVSFLDPVPRLAISLLAGALFYVFRIRHLGWGDAELLIKALGDPHRITYIWQAPLDVFIHARGYQIGNALFGWQDPLPVYHILSALAGVAFVWVLFGVAALLGRNRTERFLSVGIVGTLGLMQLFFGYIENYPIMTLGVLLYAWTALRYLRGEIALVWVTTILALTHAFHPSTIVLIPSLLYLVLFTAPIRSGNGEASQGVSKGDRLRLDWRKLLSVAVPYALVFAGVVALMTNGGHGLDALMGVDFPGGGDRKWFVPLFEVTTEWQHYTMFSWGHLVDIVNQQLLVAPMVWPTLILIAIFAWRRIPKDEPVGRYFALMAGFYLLLTLTWNADYGGQKDWDLFSPASLPAALLLAWALPRALPERPALRAAGWAIVAMQGVNLLTWVWRNTLPR